MAKKVYIGAENFTKRNLPTGYTQVEYIQSSGTQYIDTGFKPNQDTRVVIETQFIGAPDSGGSAVFGTRTGAGNAEFSVFYMPSQMFIGYANAYKFADWAYANARLTIDTNKNVTTVTDGSHNAPVTQTYSSFTAANNLYICTCINNGTPYTGATAFTGKIYSCKIYDNGTLVRDFVPCKSSSGAIGLYDLVNSAFYTNAGSGAFTAGAAYSENAAMKVKEIYLGVEAVARKVVSGYKGVDGVARQFWKKSGKLGELPVGETVYMNVNGVSTEFIVVQQGLPSTAYDSSCDGTWLMMKDAYTEMAWDSTNSDYANSDVHAYLNNTFLGLLDSGIKSAVKQVKIPYTQGSGSTGTLRTGANGLSTKCFLLSAQEINLTASYVNDEGDSLDYFEDSSVDRSCYLGGTYTYWWLRNPRRGGTTYYCYYYLNNNSITTAKPTFSSGIRPCLIMPSDATVDGEYNVIPPPMPTLGSLDVGETVYMNANGVSKEFIVVQQGRPSTAYDTSCDGTWLLMKDSHAYMKWDEDTNDYANSDIHAYLNGTFLGLLDSDIQGVIKQVRIPYTSGDGSSGSVKTGSSGLSTKAFLLSFTEVGFNASSANSSSSDGNIVNAEGTVLDYFDGASNSDRMIYRSGETSARTWSLRSPRLNGVIYVWRVLADGNYGFTSYSTSTEIRPCVILPSTLNVDGSYNVVP